MTWANRVKDIKVGDQVRYSRQFLQSTSQFTGEIPHAKGIVLEIEDYGETKLAVIDWQNPDIPAKANCKNLSKVGQIELD